MWRIITSIIPPFRPGTAPGAYNHKQRDGLIILTFHLTCSIQHNFSLGMLEAQILTNEEFPR